MEIQGVHYLKKKRGESKFGGGGLKMPFWGDNVGAKKHKFKRTK
jgi:hypothetical protein